MPALKTKHGWKIGDKVVRLLPAVHAYPPAEEGKIVDVDLRSGNVLIEWHYMDYHRPDEIDQAG